MAKNSAEGNQARTARYRAKLAARGIRPVQLYAPEGAHALLRQAAALMTREQDPLDPRAALRQAGGANEAPEPSNPRGSEQVLMVEVEAVRAELAAVQEARGRAERQAAEQAELVAAAAERADAAEDEAAAALGQAAAASEAADALRRELEAITGKQGWRGLLLRLAGAGLKTAPPTT